MREFSGWVNQTRNKLLAAMLEWLAKGSDAMEDLAAAGISVTSNDILDLFGRQSAIEGEDGGRNLPRRGDLAFCDLTTSEIAQDGFAPSLRGAP